ncbi:MAG: MBL fold metallo-hydrolase [candidate division Zixibacteria bacterium]|nr:MBL fold metallo-hydrolase [candidate division Zixibacteria bacterium]MDH3936261.1 MBL fold metallo-hydrolase [candidate division Zixibacteria bacterium]MDH4034590.1 MBL fold metallo-hydrolase [candidate division Zixibacteria bacterium]
MKLETLVVGPFEVNCYLYYNEQNGDGVIIDPGADQNRIANTIEQAGITPKAILLTHGHGDHIAAVEAVKNQYDLPLYIGAGEEELLRNPSANVSALVGHPIVAPDPDVVLADEQVITVGSITLRVLATPGHSPGGICYLDERHNRLFCGDTLFYGSIGRTDLPGGSTEVLLESIRVKILTLPDQIVCLPGHGPQTTVGAERVNNPFLVGDYLA